ncbi:MAG: sialidase [Bacillota bacterium]|nr:sialidase [Bacillota bacterium]
MNFRGILSFLLISLALLPMRVFAHGTEEEHKQEVATNTFLMYGTIISAILLIIGLVFLFAIQRQLKRINVKKQEGRQKKDKLNKILKVGQWTSALSLIALLITGGFLFASRETSNDEAVEFMHIHGLGITNDGSQIYIPAHDGLKIFKEGKWGQGEGEKHDYMGFSMVDDGFYSSGHPGTGSSFKNPFGVVKTTDMGKNLEILDLYQEIDFHGMAVGYYSHAIYVINTEPNSRMEETGLYYSKDDTKTWTKSEMNGITGQLSTIAVHPTEENIVALGTSEAIFVSKDYGQSFEKITDTPTTAVSFSPKGELLIGSFTNEITLSSFNIESKDEAPISIPTLKGENAIGYIAVNPHHENQIVFTTFEKDIFLSEDFGANWIQLAEEGTGINQEATNHE